MNTYFQAQVFALLFALIVTMVIVAANLPVFIVAGVALMGILWVQRPKENTQSHTLVFTLSTILFSFWIFVLFLRIGWTSWPMQRASTTSEWLELLYMQSVLTTTLAPAWLFYRFHNPSHHYMRWGTFSPRRTPHIACLWAGSAAAWLCATIYIARNTQELSASLVGLLAILTLKAGLYTLTEEVCFRGVVMPAIARRIGIRFAIVYQAILFTGFHLFLNPPFFTQPIFLMCVAGLGLLFGWMTYKTRGIGWAWMCHWAIGVTIEWSNRL